MVISGGDQQEQPRRVAQRVQHLGQQLGHARDAHQVLEHRGDGEQEDHRRRQDGAVVGQPHHLLVADVAIVEARRQEGVARDHRARLGGGEDAEEEAAQDDDGDDQRHGGTAAGRRGCAPRWARVSTGQSYLRARKYTSTIRQTMMVAAGMKPPRNSATAEVLVTWAITIMKMAGGTSMPDGRAGGDQRGRVLALVARLGERRHQGRAQRGDLGHLRAADVGEEVGDHDHRHAEPRLRPSRPGRAAKSTRAWLMPHFSIRPPAKTKAGMASSTQLCEPDDHAGGQDLHVVAADQQAGDAGDAEREDDRHGEQDQDDEDQPRRKAATVPHVPSVHGVGIDGRRRHDQRRWRRRPAGCRRPRRRRRAAPRLISRPGVDERAVEQAELDAVPGARWRR